MPTLLDDKKYKKRIIDSTIDRYLKVCPALCIEGPKWCGKTWTSMYHSKSGFFVGDPTNNFSNRTLASMNPKIALEGEKPHLIDEWQEVNSIWDATRSKVDESIDNGDNGQFILTGSSTPKIKGVLHSGAGRIVSIKMNTMSLFESNDSEGIVSLNDICEANKINYQLINQISLEKLAYFIIRGGFPRNIGVDIENASILPRSYIESVLKYDFNKIDDGINLHKMRQLLKSLARNESTTVADSKLINDLSDSKDGSFMSRNTLYKYLHIINSVFLLNNQKPFSPNIRSSLRVKQMEKRHFFDPSIPSAILNLTTKKLLADMNLFSFLFEALVERDLEIYASSFNGKLYHYQDYNNNEVDAIIEKEDGKYCMFEIKLGGNKIEEAASNLNKVENKIVSSGGGKPLVKCVICGFYNAIYQRDDGIYVIPIIALKN